MKDQDFIKSLRKRLGRLEKENRQLREDKLSLEQLLSVYMPSSQESEDEILTFSDSEMLIFQEIYS